MLIGPPESALIRDENGVLHVGGISGGKDSSAMALELRQRYPDRPFVWLCTPTGNEPDAMFKHWLRLGTILGSRIWPLTCGISLEGLIAQYNALPNWRQRWCTRQLKIEPYGQWMAAQVAKGPVVSYIGLRADEPDREGGDYDAIPDVQQTFPMRDWGWGIEQVVACLDHHGVCIPVRTDCEWCYHQTLFEWWALWDGNLPSFQRGEATEGRTGHTFRSPSRDTWPASMADMRVRFEAGEIPRRRARVTSCRVCSK
jgi:hypothetical protein